MENMNIAITGHKGLVGSYLKERLGKEGHRIVLAIDKREGNDVNILEGMKLGGVDMFIHAAALCKINKTIENPELGHKNALHTFQVMEFCRKNNIPRVVYFSSSRVLSPEKNPYTAGKVYGEELCKAYKDCFGIDYLIIRPSTVYGPIWDETRRLMHIFISDALKNKDLEIYGNLETKTLDFTHINDFIDGTMLAINHPEWNKEYNISGEQEHNVNELAKLIIKETGSKSKIIVKGAEIAQPQQVKVDISAIKNIGYSPKISLKQGVINTIEWYKEHIKNHPELKK